MKKRILTFGLCIFLLLSGCTTADTSADAGESDESSLEFFAMDTYITLTAYGKDAKSALSRAQEKITLLESMWSVTDERSDLYALNHAGGQAVEVSVETAELLEFALHMADKTNGALDPTVYPILTLWGFTTEEYRIPSDEEIAGLMPFIGYQNVAEAGNTVKLSAGSMIDFGAVAKGYSADIISDVLRESGITSAFLNLGGNVQAIGKKPDGSDFRVGLQDPDGEGIIGILQVSDLAVVTSGAYERYFIGENGRKYGHIMDPETGRPARSELSSVTVIAEEGKTCDALSTALFVMGFASATAYWRQNKDFDMILVTENGDVYVTAGIRERFTLADSSGEYRLHVISE